MTDLHWAGHQQAVIKNNIVTVVLSFPEHDTSLMEETFAKFDHDLIVNLCEVQQDATLNASWDGTNFHRKDFPSWILGEDLQWHAPALVPEDGNEYVWCEPVGWRLFNPPAIPQ